MEDCEYDIIEEITGIFGEIGHTYIADGHHRAASAVAVSVMRREEHPDYTGEEDSIIFCPYFFRMMSCVFWIITVC